MTTGSNPVNVGSNPTGRAWLWENLVIRVPWEHETAGSNPASQTLLLDVVRYYLAFELLRDPRRSAIFTWVILRSAQSTGGKYGIQNPYPIKPG